MIEANDPSNIFNPPEPDSVNEPIKDVEDEGDFSNATSWDGES